MYDDVYACVHTYPPMYMCLYVCMKMVMHVFVHISCNYCFVVLVCCTHTLCVHMYISICIYVYMYIHVYIVYTHMYIYIYTRIHLCIRLNQVIIPAAMKRSFLCKKRSDSYVHTVYMYIPMYI